MATEQGKKDSEQRPKKSAGGAGGKGGGKSASGAAGSAPEYAADNIRLGAAGQALFTKAAAVGVIGIAAAAGLGAAAGDDFKRFSLSYVTAYMWVLALALGALFWVTLQNLVNSHWSIVLRRVGELVASQAPLMALLALPVVVPIFTGHSSIYVWSNHEAAEHNHLLHHKAAYLNPTFFFIRFVVYFAFWTLLARYFLKSSLAQDVSKEPAVIMSRMRAVAGPAMIGFGLTMTFCAIDLLMSLDPLWFSTIFGVYYLASCIQGNNAFLALVAMWLHKRGVLKKSVTTEHFHDLGKMVFAFTIFWAYVGFSQFMLIWYANIPEETGWFKERFSGGWTGGWGLVSAILLFGHFVVPFFGLLSRHIKRRRSTLAFWCIWQLLMIYLDMYWLVLPTGGYHSPPFGLVDVCCMVGVMGVFIAGIALRAKSLNLMPTNDPRLQKSLAFTNI
ncbi:MAG: quinol:cytochrome C oxidoreductase [Myxococcales bacterium]|nr:MAG: quinol:cytochrome C oxidoreductase [Myxococcales bacterium]